MTQAHKPRCAWVDLRDPLYVAYHDKEWGVPTHDDSKHFEFLVLEAAQAGLSWRTVLHKREGYRSLFDDFDPEKVCRYDETKVQALRQDARIIRNEAKIRAAISNAAIFLQIQQAFGSFDAYLWGFTDGCPVVNRFRCLSDYPTRTSLSDKISKDLKNAACALWVVR